MKIEKWGLSVRTRNCLRRAGIHTVEDLQAVEPDDLMAIKGFGQKCFEEVKQKLLADGYQMRYPDPLREGSYLKGYREGARDMRARLVRELSRRIRLQDNKNRTILLELRDFINDMEVR